MVLRVLGLDAKFGIRCVWQSVSGPKYPCLRRLSLVAVPCSSVTGMQIRFDRVLLFFEREEKVVVSFPLCSTQKQFVLRLGYDCQLVQA